MENKALRVIFPLFLGLMVALLIGFGILAVDSGPGGLHGVANSQQILAYRSAREAYDREVSIAASVIAVVPLGVSLVLSRRAAVIANGLLLGALFSFLYAAARAMSSPETALTFPVITCALLLSLAAGHVHAGRARASLTEGGETRTLDARTVSVVFPLAAGALTAFSAALGIQTFHPQPIPPVEVASVAYDESMRGWVRGLGIIATVVAVALLVLSVVFERLSPVSANSVLLGGLFTLFYGVAPAMAFGQGSTAFFVLAVALIVVLFVGYRRFVPHRSRRDSAPKPPAATA
jgi:hypothetical protein